MRAFKRMKLVHLVVGVIVLGGSPCTRAEETPGDPVLKHRVVQALGFEGRIWLRGFGKADLWGGVVSLGIERGDRKVEIRDGAMDMRRSGDVLWILRRETRGSRRAVIERWSGAKHESIARFRFGKDERNLTLVPMNDRVLVVGPNLLRTFSPDGRMIALRKLSRSIGSSEQVHLASPLGASDVYLGLNVGEFGGGVLRIASESGEVTPVERHDSEELCAGTLDSECDPVTGVLPDPEQLHCVLASVGLWHIGTSSGRLLRICGDSVEVAFEREIPHEPDARWVDTEALFGLSAAEDGTYWAVGRKLFHFEGAEPKVHDLPELVDHDGVRLGCGPAGVVVVETDVNWGVSTSGYTPLVVALEGGAPCPRWLLSTEP